MRITLLWGLSAYAFTRSPERARRTIATLKSGMVGINSFALAASEARSAAPITPALVVKVALKVSKIISIQNYRKLYSERAFNAKEQAEETLGCGPSLQ